MTNGLDAFARGMYINPKIKEENRGSGIAVYLIPARWLETTSSSRKKHEKMRARSGRYVSLPAQQVRSGATALDC